MPRMTTTSITSIARAVGVGVLVWLGFDLFVLIMLLPLRPDNALTWWTLAFSPIPVALVALFIGPPFRLAKGAFDKLPMLAHLFRLRKTEKGVRVKFFW